jgi:prepilin-type N-terminal cleavage/methylation domain-containing protein
MSCPKKNNGFTLIEIMLALLVVTIGILTTIGLLGTSLDSSAKSHDDLNVVSFADLVFNYCHSEPNWDSIPTRESFNIPDYDQSMATIQIGSVSQFDCQLSDLGTLYTVSYLLDIQSEGNIKKMNLQVGPGYDTSAAPRIFYTELYNWAKNQ